MFDKLQQVKELGKLRSQANKLQKELEKIVETVDKNGITVSVSGDQKIRYIKIDGEEKKELTDLINDAMKKVQKESAKKMMEMGGGLGGLLGKM